MAEIVFKTYPRLFPFGMFLTGGFFMAGFSWLLLPDLILAFNQPALNTGGIILLIFFSFFILASVTCFYYLFTTKTIWLSKNKLILNYFFLPYKLKFDIPEVYDVVQISKKANALIGSSFRTTYMFTGILTSIKLKNGKVYTTNSIVESDYELLMNHFRKLKCGQMYSKKQKNRIMNYIISSFDGLLWLIIMVIVTTGLVYNIIKKEF